MMLLQRSLLAKWSTAVVLHRGDWPVGGAPAQDVHTRTHSRIVARGHSRATPCRDMPRRQQEAGIGEKSIITVLYPLGCELTVAITPTQDNMTAGSLSARHLDVRLITCSGLQKRASQEDSILSRAEAGRP